MELRHDEELRRERRLLKQAAAQAEARPREAKQPLAKHGGDQELPTTAPVSCSPFLKLRKCPDGQDAPVRHSSMLDLNECPVRHPARGGSLGLELSEPQHHTKRVSNSLGTLPSRATKHEIAVREVVIGDARSGGVASAAGSAGPLMCDPPFELCSAINDVTRVPARDGYCGVQGAQLVGENGSDAPFDNPFRDKRKHCFTRSEFKPLQSAQRN